MGVFWHGFFTLTATSGFALPLECQPANAEPNWPTYHVMNRVFEDVAGKRTVSHLNDANAIFEYNGIYHAMCQGKEPKTQGVVNWTHAVSNDLVRWYRVADALDGHNAWDARGACDGTASFPEKNAPPIIMYSPDCSVPLNTTPSENLGRAFDYPRAAIARPMDPSSPLLVKWGHEEQVVFDGEPCSFPGKVWKSEVGDYWNMLCSSHFDGNWGDAWSRYESTDSSFVRWKKSSKPFLITNGFRVGSAAGAMFNPIPGAVPGGPTHMISGGTGQYYLLGTYDPKEEVLNITVDQQYIDISGGGIGFSGGAAHWSATSNSFESKPTGSDSRLLWVAWVSSSPNFLSLVRELHYDAKAKQLVSQPVHEYTQLRNQTLIHNEKHDLQPSSMVTIPIPKDLGGALDVVLSFDLDASPSATSNFGIAVRAPADGVEGAGQNVQFFVTAVDENGARKVTVGGQYQDHQNRCSHVCPSNVTTVFAGEKLDVRVLVDRPATEVFVMGGRVAWVHADTSFSLDNVSVHLYNHGKAQVHATGISVYGMACGWRDDLPESKQIAPEIMGVSV